VKPLYRVQDFAELAGVTVRALHHYDSLGLLKPRRTEAGYRLYGDRDLERLEQIVALKFLGLPLKQIKTLLDQDALELPDALRVQRRQLERKRCLLDRAIRAIQDAELTLQPGQRPEAAVLKKIIEVIEMQDNQDWMAKYSSDAAKEKMAARRQEWTPELQERVSREWKELFRDVEAALGQDPAGPVAQALAVRWKKLVEEFTLGDPDLTKSVGNAWADKPNWPAKAQEQAQPFSDTRVWEFMGRAMKCGDGKP